MQFSLSGSGLVVLLNEFKWTKASLISTTGNDYNVVGKSVRSSVEGQEGLTITTWKRDVLKGVDINTIRGYFAKLMKESRSELLFIKWQTKASKKIDMWYGLILN